MSTFQDPASKFFRVQLTEQEQELATNVSPLTLAYIQNKIEAYASAVVSSSLAYDADPAKQVKAILEFERLKNYVAAYEELLFELTPNQT